MIKRYRKRTECITKNIGSESIIMPVADNIVAMNAMYTLNELGTYIWERIDGVNTNQDIAKMITTDYRIDFETALNDTDLFIASINHLVEEI